MEARTGGGGRASPYRGTDRRAGLEIEVGRGPVATAAILLLGLWLALVIAGLVGVEPTRLNVPLLDALLDTVAFTVVVLAGVAILLRWRLTGEAPHFYISLALLLYGIVTVGVAILAPQLVGITPVWSHALRVGGRLTAVGLFLFALRAPAVDSALRPGRVLGATAGITLLLTALIGLAPGAPDLFLGPADPAAGAATPLVGSLLMMSLWAALAFLCVRAGARHGQALFNWLGVGLGGLALAEVSRIVLGPAASLPALSALRAGAFLAILVGASLDLQVFFVAQRGSLLRSALSALSAEARQRADEAASRRLAHDALNALTAIQGASHTLERFQDRLDPTERTALVAALQTEIDRLQNLVVSAGRPQAEDSYVLANHLAPVIADLRAAGALVDVALPADLSAHGRWADTAEAVRVVLQALRTHAPARRLTVALDRADDTVNLRVEHHRGDGEEPPAPQKSVEDLPGGELQLRVAADLIRNQGGDLLVEQYQDGLAFVFVLPIAEGWSGHESENLSE